MTAKNRIAGPNYGLSEAVSRANRKLIGSRRADRHGVLLANYLGRWGEIRGRPVFRRIKGLGLDLTPSSAKYPEYINGEAGG